MKVPFSSTPSIVISFSPSNPAANDTRKSTVTLLPEVVAEVPTPYTVHWLLLRVAADPIVMGPINTVPALFSRYRVFA